MGSSGQTVGIIGATGFIGRELARVLEERGTKVVRFSRNPPGEDGWRVVDDSPDLSGLDAVVNLSGESIAQRWTEKVWERIRESRVGLTHRVVQTMARMPAGERPKVLLNGSAVGFYASSGDRILRESTAPGSGQLEDLCRDWEAAAVEAEERGVRVVRLRTGIVLGKGGEAWSRLHKVFSLGLGGRLGSGRQWMPWIHLDDEVAAIAFALERESLQGPINLCAPEPVTNREFTRILARVLSRPAIFRVPGPVLRTVLGGFSKSLLGSYRTVPARLMEEGFKFRHPELEPALKDIAGS